MHDTRQHPAPSPDLSEALAAAIAGQIDYRHLARCIAAELRDTPATAAAPDYDPNQPHPVTAIRHELGRRGRPMAHLTFQKNYLESGLLQLIPGPNRRQLYVRRGDWENLKLEIQTQKGKKK